MTNHPSPLFLRALMVHHVEVIFIYCNPDHFAGVFCVDVEVFICFRCLESGFGDP